MTRGSFEIERLSLEEIECIDSICDGFVSACQQRTPMRIEDALLQAPDNLRPVLAIELIELDYEFQKKLGTPVSLEAYCERFPAWSSVIRNHFSQAFQSDAALSTPSTIPGYEMLGELGRGGMGIVYKARQRNLGRIVALKVAMMSSDPSRNELERFRSETESAARLKHPNIVQIYDVGECEGRPFYTMEYVEGENLADRMSASPLTPLDAARLVELLADAVAFAHAAGVIHRDLKPSNILLQASPTKHGSSSIRLSSTIVDVANTNTFVPKLTDFGLAKRIDIDQSQTQTGTIIGTPSYMAPELIESGAKVASAKADVYSLGAILYEAMVGRPPFRAATILETLEMARSKEPIPPSRLQSAVPRDLETICLKCLEKEPANRYTTAAELGQDLARFIQGMPISARPVGVVEHAWRWAKRKPLLAGLSSIISVLFVALIVVPSLLAVQLRQALVSADKKNLEAVQSQRLAEMHADLANRARADAIQAAEQSQALLVGMRVKAGIASLANDPLRSLLWYQKAWQDDIYHSRSENQHRQRIGSALAQAPQMVGVCIHSQPILEATLVPLAKQVLIRDASEVISVWDPFLGRCLGYLEHGCPVRQASSDPKGALVATCGGNHLKIWRSDNQKLLFDCIHDANVHAMCFHPTEPCILSASEDGRIRAWNLDSGTLVDESWFVWHRSWEYLQSSSDGTYWIAIDTNGKLTVIRNSDRSIVLSDVDHPPPTTTGMRALPQFLQGGTKLITYAHKKFVLWDLNTGKPIGDRHTQLQFPDFKFMETGERAIGATGSAVTKLFRIDQLDSFGHAESSDFLAPRQTACCTISKDGRMAAVSSSGGLISVVQVDDGKLVTTLRTLDSNNQLDFMGMPNGNELLMVSSQDGTVRIWDLNPKNLERSEYQFVCGNASRVGWIHRGDHRAILSPDASVELQIAGRRAQFVDRKEGAKIGSLLEHTDEIIHAAFPMKLEPGAKFVVADTHRCAVQTFPTGDGPPLVLQGKDALMRLRLSHDGSRLLIWRRGMLGEVWDTHRGVLLLGDPQEGNAPSTISISSKSDYLTSCTRQSLKDIDLSPDGSFVTVRRQLDDTTHVFRVSDGKHLLRTDLQIGVASPTAFADGAQKFLVCNSDTRARIWDAEKREAAGPIMNHPTFVRFGCLNSDASLAATWSADGKLRVWNPIQGELILESKQPLLGASIWFRKDSESIVVHHREGSLYELKLPELSVSREEASRLVQLYCNEEVDFTNGINGLPIDLFRTNPEAFLRAWRSYQVINAREERLENSRSN
jgi:serine/threonine protein kinase/WD40 repeat protein